VLGSEEENITRLKAILTVNDLNRKTIACSLSPKRNNSSIETIAIADSLGRVLLMDGQDGTLLRIFKGWRNAQIGWIEFKDSHEHITLLLVMYSPRGIIELHAVPYGPKIATFQVARDLRILQTGMAIVGGIHNKKPELASVLLVSNTGIVQKIIVPDDALLI
jgi:hypothetical protein